jgi:hypothetical protein
MKETVVYEVSVTAPGRARMDHAERAAEMADVIYEGMGRPADLRIEVEVLSVVESPLH